MYENKQTNKDFETKSLALLKKSRLQDGVAKISRLPRQLHEQIETPRCICSSKNKTVRPVKFDKIFVSHIFERPFATPIIDLRLWFLMLTVG